MEIAFDAIGMEISCRQSFDNLAEDAKTRGEASQLVRKAGILHGRCWRLGAGLEVWTVLYESAAGEISYADCRPGFRAKFKQKINPWVMTEFDKSGEALIHGYLENSETEVLFALQNLTETAAANFHRHTLTVGLCGLAHRAEISAHGTPKFWKPFEDESEPVTRNENIRSLCGEIISFDTFRNPFSGSDLHWLHLHLNDFELEILVNCRTLKGGKLKIGAAVKADVWLQGHIVGDSVLFPRYEGVDYRHRTVDFWKTFKKTN